MFRVAPGLVPKPVGDHCDPAAMLVDQFHPISNSIHNLHESLSHLRMLELSGATVEEGHFPGKLILR